MIKNVETVKYSEKKSKMGESILKNISFKKLEELKIKANGLRNNKLVRTNRDFIRESPQDLTSSRLI